MPTDFAIVAGVTRYPELSSLDGPENDALAFVRWLVDRGGFREDDTFGEEGAWDPERHRLRLILSSRYASDPKRPGWDDFVQAFCALADLASHREGVGGGSCVGRRLYVFLAGHGISDSDGAMALLTANATRCCFLHVPGCSTVKHFLNVGIFQEAVLFMDCCREIFGRVRVVPLPFTGHVDPDAIETQRLFCAYAAKWQKKAREIVWEDKPHGAFTAAVLEGLKTAVDVERGGVTGRSLADYLTKNMQHRLPTFVRDDKSTATVPDIYPDQSTAESILFANEELPTATVTIRVPSAFSGAVVKLTVHNPFEVRTLPLKDGVVTQQLGRGDYMARVPTVIDEPVKFSVHATLLQSESGTVDGMTLTLGAP